VGIRVAGPVLGLGPRDIGEASKLIELAAGGRIEAADENGLQACGGRGTRAVRIWPARGSAPSPDASARVRRRPIVGFRRRSREKLPRLLRGNELREAGYFLLDTDQAPITQRPRQGVAGEDPHPAH
jgi:hypothetical protein